MNRYKLTPINLDDPCWKYSDTTEALTLEGNDENEAREKADSEHPIMGESGPLGERNPVNPWGDPDKTLCELIN